jgi:hypothetical protein
MPVDGNIGGTGAAGLAGIPDQVATAKQVGYDGVWTTEVSRDQFLPPLLAADRSYRTFDSGVPVSARHPVGKPGTDPARSRLSCSAKAFGLIWRRRRMPAAGGAIVWRVPARPCRTHCGGRAGRRSLRRTEDVDLRFVNAEPLSGPGGRANAIQGLSREIVEDWTFDETAVVRGSRSPLYA